MSRPRTSYLRACKLLALAAVGVAATLALPGAALADPSCVVQHEGSVTVLGDLTRIPQDAPYGIVVVCTGGATSPNAFAADQPLHGTLTEQSPSSPHFMYTPNPGYIGTDSFIITPQDNLTHTTYFPQVLVAFLVGDHPPVCTGSTADPVLHGGSVSAPYTCTDADGDALAASIVAQPAHGSATITATSPTSGVVTYTSSPTSSGPETVTLQAAETSNPSVRSNVAAIAFSVTDAAPTCSAQAVTVQTSTPVTFPLHCLDGDGETLTYTRTTAPKHGTVKMDGGDVTYAASSGYLGKDALAFSATDGLATATVTVAITVVPDTIRTGSKSQVTVNLPTNLTVLNSTATLSFQCPPTAKTGCTGLASLVTILKGRKITLATTKVAIKAGRGAKVKINAAQGLRNAALRPLAGLAIKVGVVYQTKNSAGKKIVTTKTIYLRVPRT
jgi:hypothetical protein